MSKPRKLIPIGNSRVVILPKNLLRELGAERGQNVSYVKTSHGIEIRPHEAEFEHQLEILGAVMRRRRNALGSPKAFSISMTSRSEPQMPKSRCFSRHSPQAS